MEIDWNEVVKLRKEHEDQCLDFFLDATKETDQNVSDIFGSEMAVFSLIELEKDMIRSEWLNSCGITDQYFDHDSEISRYVAARKKVKESLGNDIFEQVYQKVKEEENNCNRKNLDGCKGNVYCYVLPVFFDDGSHGTVGPQDVPWGTKEAKARI